MRRALGLGIFLTCALTAGLAGPVAADPVGAKNGEILPLNCGGTIYDIALNGNGEFTPGHDVDSNTVLIPVAFGTFTFVVRDAAGVILATETEDGATKGQSAKKGGFTTCTFTFSFTNTSTTTQDGVPPGGTVSGTGTVMARVTPAN